MIPLVSTLCKGPLGVAQLPRLWWKNLLHQAGRLDPGYPFAAAASTSTCWRCCASTRTAPCSSCGTSALPTCSSRSGRAAEGSWDSARVERWNKALAQRPHHIPEKIDETYGDIGWPQEEVTEVSAVLLNCLQDWKLFHRQVFAPGAGGLPGPVAPTLSSIDRGPLGICQLPRTWLKTCLRAKGLLHPDYPDCAEGSLDQRCLRTLQVDEDAALAFLRGEMPDYLEFEDWVRREGVVEEGAVAAFNRRLLEREHIASKQAEIHAALAASPDVDFRSAAQPPGGLALRPPGAGRGLSRGKVVPATPGRYRLEPVCGWGLWRGESRDPHRTTSSAAGEQLFPVSTSPSTGSTQAP